MTGSKVFSRSVSQLAPRLLACNTSAYFGAKWTTRDSASMHSVPRCAKPPVSRSTSQPSVSPCVATARHTSLAWLTLLRAAFSGQIYA